APTEAAAAMQRDAVTKIEQMRSDLAPGPSLVVLQFALLIILAGFFYWQRKNFVQLMCDLRRNRIAYLFVLPSIICIFAVIVFPFFYNIVLSLSNMSLTNFRDWRVIGFQNYV